jgi:uncharacterized YccA/Bax inhibitor family protein
VRTTSNPAFRNLPGRGGYATTFNQPGAQAYPRGYAGYGAPPTTAERPVTVDDVVTKTAITLATTVVAGLLTAYFHAYVLAVPGFIVGLVVALIIIFRRTPNPALVLTYAAAEGVALGAISALFETLYSGIVLQAIIGTVGVFIGMLVVYKTGAVRVTPRLTKWIVGATVGAAVLMLANLVMGLFTHGAGLGLRSGGPLAIGFSLLVIGIAAFNFLLDFDAADQMIRAGMPSKWAWYAAFGLMTTLVWLYLEILRLLSYLNRR